MCENVNKGLHGGSATRAGYKRCLDGRKDAENVPGENVEKRNGYERSFYKSASLEWLSRRPNVGDWKKRRRKCAIPNGDYFERDNINVNRRIVKYFFQKKKQENFRYVLNTPRGYLKLFNYSVSVDEAENELDE